MTTLLLNSHQLALWHSLVCEAQQTSEIQLHEDHESYLVFLLMHFFDKPEIAKSTLGLEFLETQHNQPQQEWELKAFGDKCLLFAGLFPELAARKRVNVRYFVNLGQTAYGQLAQSGPSQESALYESLCHTFVQLMDVLQATRDRNGISIDDNFLQLLSQWEDTGSEYAHKKLLQMQPNVVLDHQASQRKN